MSCDTPAEKREDPSPQPHRQQPQQPAGNSSGNGVAAAAAAGGRPSSYGDRRLRLNPNKEHRPERYDDVQTEFDPCIFSSLERHLPPSMLEVPRDAKVQFMKEILARYLPDGERTRVSPRPPISLSFTLWLRSLRFVVGARRRLEFSRFFVLFIISRGRGQRVICEMTKLPLRWEVPASVRRLSAADVTVICGAE